MRAKIIAALLFITVCIGLYVAQVSATPNRFDLGPTNRTNNANQSGWDFDHNQRQIVTDMRYLVIEIDIEAARAANPHGDIVGSVSLYFNGPNGWHSYAPWASGGFIPLDEANPIVIDMHASPRWNGFANGMAEWGQIYLGYYGRTFADLHFVRAYMTTTRPEQPAPATPMPTPAPTPTAIVPGAGDIVLGDFTVVNNSRQMGWEINYSQRDDMANMRFLVLDIDVAAARQANPHGEIISNVNLILNGPVIQHERNGQWHEFNPFGDRVPSTAVNPIVIDLRSHPSYNSFINGLDEWGRILIAYYASDISDLHLRRAFLTSTQPDAAPTPTPPGTTPGQTPPPSEYERPVVPTMPELEPMVRNTLRTRLTQALGSNRQSELTFGDMYKIAAEIHALAIYSTSEIIATNAAAFARDAGWSPAENEAEQAVDFLLDAGIIHPFDWEDFFWFNLADKSVTNGELTKLTFQLVGNVLPAPRVAEHFAHVTRAAALDIFMGLLGE
jgi:hypothetical protein